MGSDRGFLAEGPVTVDNPTSWSDRYDAAHTPWDLDGAHPELANRLSRDPSLGAGSVTTAYVPGCGRGHDAVALARAGWKVTASDFAPSLAEPVARALSPFGGEFVLGDSLAVDGHYDLWFDHTFFCAIPPHRRNEYGAAAASGVTPGGLVISIVFPVGRPASEGGPPFGMSTADLNAALGPEFELSADDAAAHAGRRSWPHRWAVWQRT